jgi:hypothetical protein
MGIGVEPAERHVRAGEQADAEALHLTHRQRAGAADFAHRAVGRDEAIEVPLARLQPGDHHFRAIVTRGAGDHLAAAGDLAEVRSSASSQRSFVSPLPT